MENSLEIKNEINNELNLENNQNKFLNNMLGKTINTGIDIGIRAALPDIVEDQVINIKDNVMNFGLKDGIKKSIEDAINIGKSALGIVTGNFENVEQMQMAVKSGGIIDNVSDIFDIAVNQTVKHGKMNTSVANMLKKGKNTILNSVESNIEKCFTKQINGVEKLEKYISNWKNYYNSRDFNGMEKEYKKIKNELNNLVPLENTLKAARNVENIHTLIKTNGKNFDFSETEMDLLKKMN